MESWVTTNIILLITSIGKRHVAESEFRWFLSRARLRVSVCKASSWAEMAASNKSMFLDVR